MKIMLEEPAMRMAVGDQVFLEFLFHGVSTGMTGTKPNSVTMACASGDRIQSIYSFSTPCGWPRVYMKRWREMG